MPLSTFHHLSSFFAENHVPNILKNASICLIPFKNKFDFMRPASTNVRFGQK